ncbi:MAG TPA: HK97 family phage prohead protease, partial [Candidatus Bathyarchaeia archaeon]|nr:HK97 family phage prohead protease [Candidatus Bathyarchaeia archaeon]
MKDKKPETLFRTFRSIVKAVGDEEGVIDVLIPMSTASVDRHGESIDPKGWKKSLKEFKKRSILLSSHNYGSLQNQIGELLDLQVVEEGLLARPKYYINQGNPEADWGYFLASKGKAAFSVGFIPIKWEDSDGKDGKPSRTYTEQELIEISHVTVPSNRDAIMGLQAKGIDDPVMSDIITEVLEDKEFFKAEKEVKTIIKEKLEGVKADPIDPEKVKASMEKDDKNEGELFTEEKIGYSLNDIYDIVKENKELKRTLADIELKAGAVLNAKN